MISGIFLEAQDYSNINTNFFLINSILFILHINNRFTFDCKKYTHKILSKKRLLKKCIKTDY